MQPIALDIETIGDIGMTTHLDEPEISKVLKDPEKIKSAMTTARQEQLNKMALSPYTGRVACVCAVFETGDTMSEYIHAATDEEEKRILTLTMDVIDTALPLITFNGMSFDVPFLFARAAILRVPAPAVKMADLIKRYSTGRHYDVRMVMGGWDSRAIGTLKLIYAAMTRQVLADEDYSTFAQLIADDKGQQIAKHCMHHVEATMQLYKLTKDYYLYDKIEKSDTVY